MKVAIVGTGASGLCSARHFAGKQYHITVLEKNDEVGGAWIYSPKHNNVYKNLVANIPKEIMGFPDYPFPSNLPSYVGHRDVLKYLQSYTDHFDIRKYIRFQCLVERIEPTSTYTGSISDTTKWRLCWLDLVTKKNFSEEFDRVVVCNGHYSEPYMSVFPDLEYFTGSVIHSSAYRDPEEYAGQEILLVGAGYSGTDLALDLSPHCSKVYLCNRGQHLSCPLPRNVIEMPAVSRIKEDGKVVFSNGKESLIDGIIMATGYRYTLPFLTPETGIRVVDHKRVTPVYKQTFNPLNPTIAFVGLPFDIIPFPFFDCQVRWIESVWSGRCCLPDASSMIRDEEDAYEARLQGGLIPRIASHWLAEDQWEFMAFFCKSVGSEVLPPIYNEIAMDVHHQRIIDLIGYKKMSYEVVDGNQWKVKN